MNHRPIAATSPRLASRPIYARIDGAALRHNHAVARRHAGAAKIWSVIKADAYGHGVLNAARALQSVADGFALVELENAQKLRAAGIAQPILMMEGPYAAADLDAFAALNLIPVLHTAWQIDAVLQSDAAPRWPVYLKLNTGMNRLGFDADALPSALARLRASDRIASITLMSHFADADADEDSGIERQWSRFQAMSAGLALPCSLANSAALLRFPHAIGDWARLGIMLYGASPFPDRTSASQLGLYPVMTLTSELIAVQTIAAGERIGYGGAFVAEQPMRIGIVAAGYADGYPRHAPTGTPILVEGVRTRTLGRVSMDKLCVDLTGLPAKVGAGATVTLWGEGLPADEVAAAAGTIAYELFCARAPRVPLAITDLDRSGLAHGQA